MNIHAETIGQGAPVLLLHGFPETSAMWREVAADLGRDFMVVCADLPGYGHSDVPHEGGSSKRAMATAMVGLMSSLGHDRFAVVGHDRGGRVAYRLALDHPERITALGVLDVVPIDIAWELADHRLALGFWPWSLFAQDAPLPERIVLGAPDAVLGAALDGGWGTPAETFGADVRAHYLQQLRDPARVHAICEEYRAAATVDRDHDAADRAAGRQIECPALALWSAEGPLASWYDDHGGPLALWRQLAPAVTGGPVPGGHFFPEEHPADTATALRAIL